MRLLSIVDTFTRECLVLEVDTCLPSRRVTRALNAVIAERGSPERIRMNNGSELASRHFLAWGIEQHIELVHIQPGKPVQNAHVESFNGRLRDECRSIQWFRNLWHARRRISARRSEFNTSRDPPFFQTGDRLLPNRAAERQNISLPDELSVRRSLVTEPITYCYLQCDEQFAEFGTRKYS